MSQPRVSIILATYNWTSVLRYAIQTALWQHFSDFELLVIGDACTDDTAEVVASFADPRIRWHNLPKNTGSQSGPNQAGLELARGEYTAYLHQDDLWMPNHLEILVAALDRSTVPMAHTLLLQVGPAPKHIRIVSGLPGTGRYGSESRALVTPSIIHRTAAARAIGGWRDWRATPDSPALEFWSRLLGGTAEATAFVSVPEITVIKFNSAERRNSYVEKTSAEQARYFQRIQSEPDLLYRETLMALDHLKRGWKSESLVTANKPQAATPGWVINQYRQIRGLVPMDAAPISEAAQRRDRLMRPIRWLRNHLPDHLRRRLARTLHRAGTFLERLES
jgi:glycosyltransferase involved in cell wall biosynthesis